MRKTKARISARGTKFIFKDGSESTPRVTFFIGNAKLSEDDLRTLLCLQEVCKANPEVIDFREAKKCYYCNQEIEKGTEVTVRVVEDPDDRGHPEEVHEGCAEEMEDHGREMGEEIDSVGYQLQDK